MGSVNRDFVFTQIQAGVQTHNSHMDTHADVHAEGKGGQLAYCKAINRIDREHVHTCRCSM